MQYAARLRVRSYSKVGLLYVRLRFTVKLILVQGSWSFPIRIASFYHKEGVSPSTTACRTPLSVLCVPFRDGQVVVTPTLITPFCSCYPSSHSLFFWFSKWVFSFPQLARKRLAEQKQCSFYITSDLHRHFGATSDILSQRRSLDMHNSFHFLGGCLGSFSNNASKSPGTLVF